MTTAIPPSQRASIYGSQTRFRNLRKGGSGKPQRVAVIAQGNTAVTYVQTKMQVSDAQTAGETYGFGSQIHAIVEQLLPSSGDGVGSIPVTIYPMVDGTTEATATITPAGSPTAAGTYFVKVNNIITSSFALAASASVADATAAIDTAINAVPRMPVTSADGTTVVNITCKWKGVTGNQIANISVEGPSLGMTFGIVQMASGAGNPVIDSTVLDQFGDVWESFVIQSNGDEAASLNAMAAFNEGRWLPTIGKFLAGSFYASVEPVLATSITIPDARGTDRTNVQLTAPGCEDLPWAIAARMVARAVVVADSASAASDYVRQEATGLTPGLDSLQWSAAERQTAVVSGTSTSEVRDGLVTLSDTVTMYHPSGDPTPAYRYVNDIVKLQNLQADLRAIFDTPEWIGAPLIPDGQATVNRSAKKPEMAVTAVQALIDDWANKALISDPATAKASVLASIDSGNNRRLNISLTVQLSGNANIISNDLDFGFFFGEAA
jgi:phage tail sheath gpL-like